jgi:hypothetical protein
MGWLERCEILALAQLAVDEGNLSHVGHILHQLITGPASDSFTMIWYVEKLTGVRLEPYTPCFVGRDVFQNDSFCQKNVAFAKYVQTHTSPNYTVEFPNCLVSLRSVKTYQPYYIPVCRDEE